MQATPGAPLTVGATTRRRSRLVLLATVAVVVLALDAVSKAIAVEQLGDGTRVRLLGGLLHLTLTRNSGAAFGLGAGATVLFTLVAVVVVGVIVRTAARLASAWWALALGLLLGGAVGNLADRLLRDPAPLRGRVVDWIQLPHWPVFNLADSAIVVGGLLAVVLSSRGVRVDGSTAADARA
jgi:signal peptidase II